MSYIIEYPCFQNGHYRGRAWVMFPHICPGLTCAIEKWINR